MTLLADAARRAAAYLAGQDARAVTPTPEAVRKLAQLRRPFPETGAAPEEVLAELDAVGSPAAMVTTNGRYFGFVNGGTDPAAHAASVLAGAWDQNVALPVMSPIGAALDEVAAAWVVEALHLPEAAVASFCAGATVANLTCVITARDALLARAGWDVSARGLWGAPRLRVVMGDEVHISALKALRLAGFGLDSMERVPTDALGRVRAEAFPADTDDKTLVILQAGNVNTGYSDPFAEIVPVVRERGGWVHVDGAFGLWAAASPAKRALVEGVALADSWAADCHKWLNTPYDTGVAIARSRADLR
ncbi:MAG: pyridoxal phosphate-dependent decarboxylase family protein, partial [Solirubrobacteraceae bacterium]